MSCRWLVVCLVGLVGPWARAPGADKAAPVKSVADQVADLKQQAQERERKFSNDLGAAGRDRDKIRRANDDYHKAGEKLAGRLRAVIRAHPRDPAAFEGMLVLVGTVGHPLDDDLVALVRRHHLADQRLGRLCFDLRYRTTEAWAEGLLRAAAAGHPVREARGQALFALGDYCRLRASAPWGPKPPAADAARDLAEAARHYTRVRQDYAAVRTPDGKHALGDRAARELTRLRNLANLKVGRPAPEIEGEDLDGKRFKLSDYRGKVVVLDFWGHW
jgi:hypothetical protein